MQPITAQEWVELLRPLPLDADRDAVYRAVVAAIDEYVGGADRDRRLRETWQQVGRHADSQSMRKYCAAVLQLRDFPDPQTKALLDQVSVLLQVHSQAEIRAAVYVQTERLNRFRSGVSLAWTGPGKGRLSISEAGPFVNFLTAICARVEDPLDGAGVKKFVRREKVRRAVLNSIKEVWSASGDMRVDDAGIYLLDPAGRRKS